ncbi:hypothetical protein HYS91_06000 [Candidatus Daviesbacteria bacterium]|nr:hypothetical protein [Candidatus Daviesbacteria bacterium]
MGWNANCRTLCGSLLKEFAAKEKLVPILSPQNGLTKSRILDSEAIGKIVLSAPVPAFTFQFRSGRQDEVGARARCGGNSARRAQPVLFGYFQTDTAYYE